MTDIFDELRDKFVAAGWRVQTTPDDDQGNLVRWRAWLPKRPADWPDCECNDKAPALSLRPFHLVFPNGHKISGVDFWLCGQMGGRWFDLKMYSVSPEEAFDAASEAIEVLGAAWKAVASAPAPSL